MKRAVTLALISAAAAASIGMVQREHITTQPGPQALLTAVADTQHELTLMPVRLDRLSDADEIAVGDAMAKRASASLGVDAPDLAHNADIQAYLQRVGSHVAGHARRKLPWTFHYIPSPEFVNAFALPGGHVFVGEGLLKLVGNEDALAAVLGHEVEHIDLRHCAERVQTETRLRQLGALGDIVDLPAELFMAGYSKEEELEADRDGTILAVQSGYTYTGIVGLFDQFIRLEAGKGRVTARPDGPMAEAAQLSLSALAGYFASHPPSQLRSQRIRELASERGWPAQPPSHPLLKRELQPNHPVWARGS
jgi:beta-barrel assembly-enhancing protease